MTDQNSSLQKPIDKVIFFPALIAVLLFAIPALTIPEWGVFATEVISPMFTNTFGWLYVSYHIGCLITMAFFALGPWGKIKLGTPEEKPDFSTSSWLFMCFTASIGTSIMVWGFVEPIYNIMAPPFSMEPSSNEAIEWALVFPIYHWGISGWAMYVMPAIPLSYYYHAKKNKNLRISAACAPVLGDKNVSGLPGKIIEIIVVVATVCGISTSFALAVPLVSALIHGITGWPENTAMTLIVMLVWLTFFAIGLGGGLKNTIRKMSDYTSYLALAFVAFILVVGSTIPMLKLWINSLGIMFSEFVRMSFWLDPVANTGFTHDWTIYYWAWYLALGPMMTLFVTRISKGRTIRELVVVTMVGGSLGSFLFMGIFGAYAVTLDMQTQGGLQAIMTNMGQYAVIGAVFETLPLSKVMMFVTVLLCIVLFSTSMNACAYALAATTTKGMQGDSEPKTWNLLFWAGVMATLTLALLLVGGIDVVKTASVVGGLPMIPICIMLVVAFFKSSKTDPIFSPSTKVDKVK